MEFTPETKIKDILETYPELKDKLPEVNEKLSIVKLVDQGKYIDLIVNSILESMILGALLGVPALGREW